jgi:hypothetical protein
MQECIENPLNLEKCCTQKLGHNNQLPTKSPVDLGENLMAPNFVYFRIIKVLLKQLDKSWMMNMLFRYEVKPY